MMKRGCITLLVLLVLAGCEQTAGHEDTLSETDRPAQTDENSHDEINIARPGRIDASEMTVDAIDGDVNIWENYQERTFGFGLEEGDSVWIVKRSRDALYIQSQKGNGWVDERFVIEQ